MPEKIYYLKTGFVHKKLNTCYVCGENKTYCRNVKIWEDCGVRLVCPDCQKFFTPKQLGK